MKIPTEPARDRPRPCRRCATQQESDFALPGVKGRRSAKVRGLNAYVDHVLRVAEHDEMVSGAFQRVVGMLDRPNRCCGPRSRSGSCADRAAIGQPLCRQQPAALNSRRCPRET